MAGRAAEREAFFASLPPVEFTPFEAALRQALLDFLRAKPGHLPLIEWIDRRLGGEIETSRDENGQGEISLLQAQGGNPAAAAGQVSQNSAEAFFGALPSDAFKPEEEALRESIFNFLAAWKSQELANLSHLGADRTIQERRRDLMPAEVSLGDWIERRIGGEVELKKDSKGQLIIHLTPVARPIVTAKYEEMVAAGKRTGAAPPQKPRDGPSNLAAPKGSGKGAVNKEAWFASLPTTELTREEAALRQALLDWLRDWPKWRAGSRTRTGVATLSEAAQDPEIARCTSALLPATVPVRDWIDRRVGGEIELRKDEHGQIEIMVRGSRPAAAAAAAAAVARREEAPREPPQEVAAPPASAENFLAHLPDDELTQEELNLRQAVLDYLETHAGDASAPLLSDMSKDRLVRDARGAFLPQEVPLRLWLDRRIGGEVEIFRDDKTQLFLVRIRGRGPPAAAAAPATAPVADVGGVAGGDDKEQFFETLPQDRFTEDEERLREAILVFLESWKDPEPATLGHASNDPEIRKHRLMVLPKGVAVSLRDWIDRRMGGEVETVSDAAGQVVIGQRGQLDHAALARKRRPDGGGNAAGLTGGKGLQRPGLGGKPAAGGPGPVNQPSWKRPRVAEPGEGKGRLPMR